MKPNYFIQITFALITGFAIFGSIKIPFIYAGIQCSPCSCTGNGTCSGCKFATTTPTGTVGFYISVPTGTYYNYCIKNPNSTNPCTTSNIACYQVPFGTFVNIYSDSNCSELIGQGVGPFYVMVQGCTP